MRRRSSLKKERRSAFYGTPWVWIAILYGLQTLGSMILIRLLKLPTRDVVLPLLLLLLGTITASVLSWRDKERGVGQKSYWIPIVIYALFIFSLSQRSFSSTSFSVSSNYFHPLEYGTFGFFLCLALHPLIERKGVRFFSLAVISFGVIYGISDEVHQSFIPGRNCSFFDLLLDTLGLCFGCAAFLSARPILKRAKDSRLEEFAYVSGEKSPGRVVKHGERKFEGTEQRSS